MIDVEYIVGSGDSGPWYDRLSDEHAKCLVDVIDAVRIAKVPVRPVARRLIAEMGLKISERQVADYITKGVRNGR